MNWSEIVRALREREEKAAAQLDKNNDKSERASSELTSAGAFSKLSPIFSPYFTSPQSAHRVPLRYYQK